MRSLVDDGFLIKIMAKQSQALDAVLFEMIEPPLIFGRDLLSLFLLLLLLILDLSLEVLPSLNS